MFALVGQPAETAGGDGAGDFVTFAVAAERMHFGVREIEGVYDPAHRAIGREAGVADSSSHVFEEGAAASDDGGPQLRLLQEFDAIESAEGHCLHLGEGSRDRVEKFAAGRRVDGRRHHRSGACRTLGQNGGLGHTRLAFS